MIVGIDVGTQSLKVVVCNPQLTIVGRASRDYNYVVPQAGWAQQTTDLWTEALAPTIADALRAGGVSARSVTAVGIAGQLDGCVAVDARCRPLHPALIWMDRRAARHLPTIDADSFLEVTGQVLDASHMAAKIAWLKSERVQAARFHQPVSFLVELLCGEAVFDLGHASTTMLFDQQRLDYSADYLDAFGIRRDELPRIARSDSIAGTISAAGAALTGLIVGTPVCVGTGDDFATPLGAGIKSAGTVACVIGTAEVVGAICETRIIDRGRLLETHNYVEHSYFLENPGWLAGGSIRWATEVLSLPTAAALDAVAGSSPPGARGVVFVPALSGAMAPRWEPNARGCFYGMSANTDQADLARAVLEGCAFAMNDVVIRLVELGVEASRIVLLGGGSRSALWAQIRADVSGLPVHASIELDSCALGAALLAAVASGAQPSIAAAVSLVGELGATFEPMRDLSGAYQRYRTLFASLTPMFEL